MQQPQNMTESFHEEQQFRQPWVWLPLLIITLGLGCMFVYGLYVQLYLGQPWGDRPMTDSGLVITAMLSLALMGGTVWLFYVLKLITRVDAEGVYVRFFPLTRKRIPFENITSCQARTYRPVREYGGWGIRFSRKGMAYNVHGNTGVQLTFKQGKPLLIGSQKPDQLAAVINAYLSRSTPD
ncbi:MAG: hypothetical protein HKO86_02865 [Gammaproteobacteria bacterium]|nr:hypothetical protein [Gammaproteobacteria bacterium]